MTPPANLMRCVLAVLLMALFLPPFESAHGQWNVPSELLERVSTLSDEQVEFITSGAALKFIPEQQLEHELATRDAVGLQNLVNDLISLSAEMGYDSGRDMGATPSQYRLHTIQRIHAAHAPRHCAISSVSLALSACIAICFRNPVCRRLPEPRSPSGLKIWWRAT